MRLALVIVLIVTAGCTGPSGSGSTTGSKSGPHGQWPHPSLADGHGWVTRTSTGDGIAGAEASTTPLQDPPGVFPSVTLQRLPRGFIVIFASGWLAQSPPPSLSLVSAARPQPYQLSQFRHDRGWEGQPAPNVPQFVLFTSRDKHLLDVRVFFGTQHPSRQQVARAQRELNTLSWG